VTGGPPPKPIRSREIGALLDLMAALRDPLAGCPWDLRQSFASIAPYTIEEAYEVADAIDRADLDDLRGELGDLLLQVVFHARMAEEQGAFDFGGVVEAITAKLIRRHPHVFGDGARDMSLEAVQASWAEIKQTEKRERAALRVAVTDPSLGVPSESALADVPISLPALMRADRLARKAAQVGFTWPDAASVLSKVEEELAELREALQGGRAGEIADELGDVIFTLANLGRYAEVDPEAALAATNRKFERRFRFVEAELARLGRAPGTSDLEEMERFWKEAKAAEPGRRVSPPVRPTEND